MLSPAVYIVGAARISRVPGAAVAPSTRETKVAIVEDFMVIDRRVAWSEVGYSRMWRNWFHRT